MNRPLKRIPDNYNEAALAGVCAGIAYWLGWPVRIVRLLWIMMVLLPFTASVLLHLIALWFAVLLYLGLWLFLPDWEDVPEDYEDRCQKPRFARGR